MHSSEQVYRGGFSADKFLTLLYYIDFWQVTDDAEEVQEEKLLWKSAVNLWIAKFQQVSGGLCLLKEVGCSFTTEHEKEKWHTDEGSKHEGLGRMISRVFRKMGCDLCLKLFQDSRANWWRLPGEIQAFKVWEMHLQSFTLQYCSEKESCTHDLQSPSVDDR